MTFDEIKPLVIELVYNKIASRDEKLKQICELLEENITYYNWVGFYFRNGKKEELILGPYVGAPTDHTIIPFGKGICAPLLPKLKSEKHIIDTDELLIIRNHD